jgi:hypothetical protein
VGFIAQLYNRCAAPSNSARYLCAAPSNSARYLCAAPSNSARYHCFDGLDMPRDLGLRDNFGDASVAIDDDRRTLYTHVLASIERFLLPDPEGIGEPMAFIGEEPVGQLVFLFEFPV